MNRTVCVCAWGAADVSSSGGTGRISTVAELAAGGVGDDNIYEVIATVGQ